MTMQLEPLWEAQENAASQRSRAHSTDGNNEAFICFDTALGSFAVPITFVREVADSFQISPYPTPTPGHIGIVSLRGQVLPVIAPPSIVGESDAGSTRLMVFELTPEKPFAICTNRVQKFQVSKSNLESGNATLNIEGKPVRLVSGSDFFPKQVNS